MQKIKKERIEGLEIVECIAGRIKGLPTEIAVVLLWYIHTQSGSMIRIRLNR